MNGGFRVVCLYKLLKYDGPVIPLEATYIVDFDCPLVRQVARVAVSLCIDKNDVLLVQHPNHGYELHSPLIKTNFMTPKNMI